jgi:hypothetical protein
MMIAFAMGLTPYLIIAAAAVGLIVSVLLHGVPATIGAIFPRLN